MVLNVGRYWIVQQPGTKNSWLHIIIYFSVLISIPSFRQWHHNINIANLSSSIAGKVLFSVTEKYNLLSCIIDRDISNFAIRCSILYRESLIHYVQVFLSLQDKVGKEDSFILSKRSFQNDNEFFFKFWFKIIGFCQNLVFFYIFFLNKMVINGWIL